MTKKLTDKQEKLLEFLYSDQFTGDIRAAADYAGYSRNSDLVDILRGIREEFLDRSELSLLMKTPKAIKVLAEILDSPKPLGSDTRLKAATEIMDRIGLVKKEKVEIKADIGNALLILPSKDDG